ncbi:hypothetical protein VTK26DRAFT_5951 [Humicola hyalothermophila]
MGKLRPDHNATVLIDGPCSWPKSLVGCFCPFGATPRSKLRSAKGQNKWCGFAEALDFLGGFPAGKDEKPEWQRPLNQNFYAQVGPPQIQYSARSRSQPRVSVDQEVVYRRAGPVDLTDRIPAWIVSPGETKRQRSGCPAPPSPKLTVGAVPRSLRYAG